MEESSIRFRETSRLVSAMRCLAASVLITVCATIRADVPSGPELLEAEHALSMEVETPHTKWAKPYAQGTTRVLFFGPWYQGGTECREMIELMQRFDLDADAVYCFPPGERLVGDGNPRWYGDPELGTKRLLSLLEQPYDVIFMNQIPLAKLNEKARVAVLAAVEKGGGLVYVGKESADELQAWGDPRFIPQDQAQHLEPGQSIAASDRIWLPGGLTYKRLYSHGKGRIMHLATREALAFEPGWEIRLDLQMEHQGRALLWAANKLPKAFVGIANNPLDMLPAAIAESAKKTLHFTGATCEPVRTIAPDAVSSRVDPTAPWMLHWGGLPAASQVSVRIRDGIGTEVKLFSGEVADTGMAPLEIPWLPDGVYQFEAFAWKDGSILSWSSDRMKIASQRALGELTLTRNWAEAGEEITGTIEVEEVQTGDSVRVRALDGEHRILAEMAASPGASGVADFALEVAPWFPMLVRVEAALLSGDYIYDLANAQVRITNRRQNQFHFVLWNAHSTDLAPYGAQAMAKYGVTSVLQNNPLPALSAANLAFVPYASSFRASSHSLLAMLDENGVLKSGCVHDEEGMAKFVAETVERARGSREMGTFVYSLGDENAVRAGCLSEHCRVAYQNYLREKVYKTIDALNASWGTTYTSFDQVEVDREGDLPAADAPQWFKEYYAQRRVKHETDSEVTGGARQIELGDINDEIRALQDGNFARWYDRQDFQNWSYVQWCKRFVKAFRELDPHSLTGFEGTDSFSIRRLTTRSRQGGDLDLFMREMEYFGPYHNPANEVVRSLAKGNFPRGNWIGYSMDPDEELGYYWNQISDGFNAIQWWRLDNVGEGYHGFLAPDLAPSPTSRALIEDTQIVRDGLGDLLMRCEMQREGIALLYSLPSTYIAHFDGNPSYGLYVRDHEHWIDALHDAGVQFDYVTDRQLRLGEFDASKYKILVLPLAFAIGDKEAEVIRKFVAGGGTLIADVRPGLYDDRCKPREGGVLDDVFGVKRTHKQDAMGLDRMRIQGELNGQPLYMEWGNWYGKDIYPQMYTDPTVELTTGEALGWNYPIHFHHGLKYPAGVVNKLGNGTAILLNFAVYPAPFDDFLGQLLAASGVAPSIVVRETEAARSSQAVARLLDEGEQAPEAGSAGSRIGDGDHPVGLEVTRWKQGELELVALLDDVDREVKVSLPESRYVYDLRGGAALGEVREFTTRLRKARASFFALLPDAAQPPAIDFGAPAGAPGTVLTPTIAIPGATGARALKLHLAAPNGHEASWIADHTVIEGGQGQVKIPFALNDPRGPWMLRAKDILTGAEATATITLE